MQAKLIFSAPYLVSFLLSVGIGFYSLGRKKIHSALPFSIMALSQAAWTMGFIIELYSPDLAQKLFWDNVQFIPGIGWLVAFFAFSIQYAGRSLKHPVIVYTIVSIVPCIISVLAFTDVGNLIRINPVLISGDPFDALHYGYGTLIYLSGGYGYLVQIISTLIIIRALHDHLQFYRTQGIVVITGNLVPLAGTVLSMLNLVPLFHRDISPFTFAIGSAIVALALFRFRLFELVPIARDAIIEQIENPIIVLDRQDRIVDLNPAANSLLLNAQIGERIQDAATDWPEVVAELDGKDEFQTEIVGDIEGDMRYFDLNLLPLHDKKGRNLGHLIHAHEISDRKYTEYALHARTKELEDLLDRLEATQRQLIDGERYAALGKLTSVVSHELRNPLGTVRNALFSIKDSVDAQSTERIERAIAIADKNVVRCDLIIEELLNYTRHAPAEAEVTDLDSWISGVLTDYECSPVVSVDFDPGFGDKVPIEREKFRRALINLLSNACQAIENGDMPHGMIVVSTTRRGGSAIVSVADNGEGIPDGALDRIFEPLFSTRKIGVGLGLAIVNNTIKDHGGTIEVESLLGEGTKVSVIIPEHRAHNM